MGTLKVTRNVKWIDGRYIERNDEDIPFDHLTVVADKDNHCFFVDEDSNGTNYFFEGDTEVGFIVENSDEGRMIIGTCKEGSFETLFFKDGRHTHSIDNMTILEKTNNGFDLVVFRNPGDREPMRVIQLGTELIADGATNHSKLTNNASRQECNNISSIKTERKMTKKNGIFDSMLNAYKSQFLPEKENNINISTDGTLCVRDTNGAFIGINKDNELVEYPEGLTIQIPVFSINKKTADVKEGDIIKNKNSFSKVIEKKADGTLRCLSFSGYNQNRKQIKNVLLGTAMTRVVLNLFDFNANGGDATTKMLPLLLLGEGGFGGEGLETIMAMQMLGGGGNANLQGILPFLLLKDGKIGKGGDTLETIVMMQALGGGNANLQGILPFLLLKDGKFGGEGLETIMAMQMLGGGANPLANIANIFGGTATPTPAPAETAEVVTEE